MNLLITGAWKASKEQLEKIRAMGHNVIFMQNESDDLPCPAASVEGAICNGLFLYHDIEKFVNLRYVQLTSAGLDRVPSDLIEARKIKIYNARGVYSIPMAEFAVSGVLQLYKQSRFFCENQKLKKWEKRRDLLELDGKTVLIVGCGSVGSECAKRFKAFGCTVLGADLFPYENVDFDEMKEFGNLDEMISRSDIVILTVPLTDKTRYLFGKARFAFMKKGAVLVNISRGQVVEESALATALDEVLLGAVIDVFEEEPLRAESPLWTKSNAIITPHNSFVGDGNGKRLFSVIKRNLSIGG